MDPAMSYMGETIFQAPGTHKIPARSRGPLGPLRPVPGPFDIGDTPGPSLHNPEAAAIAETISITVGEHHPEIDDYLSLLGYAPTQHLLGLRQRGAKIFFAPTIAHYLHSAEADRRRTARGYPKMTANDRAATAREFGSSSSALAIYDPQTDALVLPYLRRSPDKLRALLHELGHAMTHHQLAGREDKYAHVLSRLPERIRQHLACGYAPDLAVRVHESFAEAYAMLVCGRAEELGLIVSDLVGILSSVHERPGPPKNPRWTLDPSTGRSASLTAPDAIESVGPIPDIDQPLPVRSTAEARRASEEQAA